MSGFAFEDAVETLFDRLGYDAEAQAKTADMGRDVIARSHDETLVIECKHTKSSISRPAIQKLHSAAMTFEEGDEVRAVAVSTGGFTGPAEDYADELDDTLELWDYATLVEHARAVDVYFTSERQGTSYVFRGPEEPTDELRQSFREEFVESLESEPRSLSQAVEIQHDGREYVPAVLVEYELDEQFGTQAYPTLYRARDRGRHLVPLEEIPDKERDLWRSTSFTVTCSDELKGRPPSSYFGVELETFEERIQRKMARRHSTTVHYEGRNNQNYSKECEVEPDDIETRCRQVLLCRRYVRMGAGPEDYHFAVSGHRDQPPAIVEAYGLERTDAGRIRRGDDGILCNDCADIESERAHPPPATCDECGRTLCHRHHWPYPSKWPLHQPSLCAPCYRSSAERDATLNYPMGGVSLALLGPLAPGLPWAIAGRYLGGFLFFTPFAVVLAGLVHFGPSATYGQTSLIAAAAIWILHLLMTWHWARRLSTHQHNLDAEELEDYEPEWG